MGTHEGPLWQALASANLSALRRPVRPRGHRDRRCARPDRPPTTRTRAPGIRGATTLTPKTTASETRPTTRVATLVSPRVLTHERSSWSGFEPEALVPVSLGSSPITTSMAAPKRNPVTTARERNCATHPILKTASSRNKAPEARVIVATKEATSRCPRDAGGHDGARRDRCQPGARTGRNLAARSEDGVQDCAGGRGVEPVL